MIQPDGRFAIYSSVVEDFILVDGDANDVVNWFVGKAAQEALVSTTNIINALLAGGKPYHQFTKTWEELQHDTPG